MSEMTPIVEEAIRQMLVIDGMRPECVAENYGITVQEARDAADRAQSVAEARMGSNAEAWRHSVVHICLDVAAQAQEAFEKSRGRTVKKTKKEGPKGDFYETKIEHKAGDPRFLNTRLAAAQTIAQIQIPDLPREVNINTRSQHDVTFRIENMTDEEIEQAAMIAKLEQDGVLVIDGGDFRRIEESPVAESEKSEDNSGLQNDG